MTKLEAMYQVKRWNEHVPVGSPVVVMLDDGSERRTETMAEAWLVAEMYPLVKVNGIVGGFSLVRVTDARGESK